MNIADAAVMILLMCSPTGADCIEMGSQRSYQTTDACRDDLPSVLRRMNAGGERQVSGRCALLDDLGVDPIITGSTEQKQVRVLVTRAVKGEAITQEYLVPAHDSSQDY